MFNDMQKEMRSLTAGMLGKDGLMKPFGGDMLEKFGNSAFEGTLPPDMIAKTNNPNGYSFCHSSVTKFDDKGKKYQKTHTLNRGPDGLKEERKTLEDRDEALKQMSLGQYIHERGIETEKTKRGAQPIETRRTLHHMNDDQVSGFESEWKEKAGACSGLMNIGFGYESKRAGNHRRLKPKM